MAHIFVNSEKGLDVDGNVVNIHHHVNSNPKVVGHIVLPDAPKKHKCVCDDCGNEVDDSFGDPRVRVTTNYADGSRSERFICANCEFDQWDCNDVEPHSIFDGAPDWIRMMCNSPMFKIKSL
jgi:hypothetical protein